MQTVPPAAQPQVSPVAAASGQVAASPEPQPAQAQAQGADPSDVARFDQMILQWKLENPLEVQPCGHIRGDYGRRMDTDAVALPPQAICMRCDEIARIPKSGGRTEAPPVATGPDLDRLNKDMEEMIQDGERHRRIITILMGRLQKFPEYKGKEIEIIPKEWAGADKWTVAGKSAKDGSVTHVALKPKEPVAE